MIRHRRRRILSRSIAIGSVIITVAVAVVIFVFRLGPLEADQPEQPASENVTEPAETRVQAATVPIERVEDLQTSEQQLAVSDDELPAEPLREFV